MICVFTAILLVDLVLLIGFWLLLRSLRDDGTLPL